MFCQFTALDWPQIIVNVNMHFCTIQIIVFNQIQKFSAAGTAKQILFFGNVQPEKFKQKFDF